MMPFRAMMASALTAPGEPPPAPSGIISSIQQVEITIADTDTTGTATISTVDTSRTAVFFSYGNAGGARQADTTTNVDLVCCRVSLTNATTVTATRGSSGEGVAKVLICTVVEFTDAAVDSVQQGTVTLTDTNTSNTATISSVTTSRSVVLYNGVSVSADVFEGASSTYVALTNATTVTVTRGIGNATSHTLTTGYTVIQFASGVVDSVHPFAITVVSAASATATISSVDTTRTVTFAGGMATDNGRVSADEEMCYCALTNATTVTATRINNSSARYVTIGGTMVQFAEGVIESIQRGVVTMATTDATKDTTISEVDLDYSVVQALGTTSTSAATIDPEEQYFTLGFTSTTNIRSTIGDVGGGRDVIYSYEVVEYAA